MIRLKFLEDLVSALGEQVAGDENDLDTFGMDAMTRKRLGAQKLLRSAGRKKPQRPMNSKVPYSLAKIHKLGKEEDVELSLRNRSYIGERRKVDPSMAFPGEERKVRPGSFKISSKMLDMIRKEANIRHPEKVLFKAQRDYIEKISPDDLAKIWEQDHISDAQDVIATYPKKAFRLWMKNIGKVAPRMAKAIRAIPENVPIWFYATILRVVGREMADILLKMYFVSEPSQSWRGKLRKED